MSLTHLGRSDGGALAPGVCADSFGIDDWIRSIMPAG